MWHGWSDPQVPAEHSILYYENVLRTVGADAKQSIALFMLPLLAFVTITMLFFARRAEVT